MGFRESLARTRSRLARAAVPAARMLGIEPWRTHGNPFLAAKLYPIGGGRRDYVVPRGDPTLTAADGDPVPPPALWWGYGETADAYVASGRADVKVMLGLLERAGAAPSLFARTLDFGCAAARMLRHFPVASESAELWGVDISAPHIDWCQQHMSLPFRFVTTTTVPHLPFDDGYFDLVYCGSVFTHISDLADAWLLELRRVARPGGYLYVTVHDQRSLELILTRYRDDPLFADLVAQMARFERRTGVLSRPYAYFSVGADPVGQVFYDREYLVDRWSRFLHVLSVTPGAHDHQTAIVMQRDS